MNKSKIIITMKDIQKYKVSEDVVKRQLTGLKTTEILSLTNVHISGEAQKKTDKWWF